MAKGGAVGVEAPVDEEATWFADPEPSSQDRGTTYLEAIRFALEDALAADPRVVLLGEDIGTMGGAFRVTKGLHERFGEHRVIDTPIAEAAIVGAGIGLAISGWRPVVELQFADFASCAYDQLVTEAAKLHYRFGVAVPMVVRAPSGAGVGAGPFHSQSPEGTFAHVPGLKVVCPGTVQDAYDLLHAALADPNPVLFFEHKALYRSLRAPLVRGAGRARLGEAHVVRPGRGPTVITYGAMLRRCLSACDALSPDIDPEILDLRTISPLDWEAIERSAQSTGRVLIVHEDNLSFGVGAEIAARITDRCFFDLDAPIRRVAALDTPVPFAKPLEDAYLPSPERIRHAIEELARC